MKVILCINSFEFYDLINAGIHPQQITQMTLEEIEKIRPVDIEDMEYINTDQCANCPNKSFCGEYKRK